MSKLEDVVEDKAELQLYLDGLNLQLKEKATNILKAIKNYEAPTIAIDEEIKRLQSLKKSYLSKVDSLKEYVAYNMTKNNIEKIETDIVTFSFRKSSAVEILDETLIPKEFIKKVVKESIDKTAIKKAISQGKEVVGAKIEERRNLQIK